MASQTMKAFKTYKRNHADNQLPRRVFRLLDILCELSDSQDPFRYRKGLKLAQTEYPCGQRNIIGVFAEAEAEGYVIKLSDGYGGKNSVWEFLMPDPCVPERGCNLVHTWSRQRVHSDTKEGALEDKEVCTLVLSSVHSLADNKPSLNLSKPEVKSKITSTEKFFNSVMALTPYKIFWGWQIEKEFKELQTHKELSIESIAWAIRYYFKKIESTKFQKEISTFKEVLKLILDDPQQVVSDFAKVKAKKLAQKRLEEECKVKDPIPDFSKRVAELSQTLSVDLKAKVN
jgi:hypothetical protein